MSSVVPGLAFDGGWRAFAALSAEAQRYYLHPWLERLRAFDANALARWARLPLGEVVASPFGLRAVALAVRVGATTVDRETRTLLDWTVSGAVDDPRHGQWEAGRLHVGKYQAFLQDAPFATYDPAHIAKWGPHDLMHRAAGFFWRQDASRFELYLGARLNELLPVALWYGPDQFLRLDERGFVRATAAREARAEDARWREGDADVRPTQRWLQEGFEHVRFELEAIDRERASGRLIPTPHARGGATLDASSDALAYVVAHAERLADPSVAEALGPLPADVAFRTVGDYRAHIEATWDALFFGDFELDETAIASARALRVAWDQRLRRALTDDPDATVEADGLEAFDLDQLHDGVLSVAPVAADRLAARDEEWLERFAFGDDVRARAPLGLRLERHLRERDAEMADLVRFEHLLATATPGDHHRLGDPDASHLARNDAFVLHRFDHDVVALHAGAAPTGATTVLIGRVDEDVAVVPIDDAVAELWAQLEHRALPREAARIEHDWVDALLDAKALLPVDPP